MSCVHTALFADAPTWSTVVIILWGEGFQSAYCHISPELVLCD